jgi:hypothetical protein
VWERIWTDFAKSGARLKSDCRHRSTMCEAIMTDFFNRRRDANWLKRGTIREGRMKEDAETRTRLKDGGSKIATGKERVVPQNLQTSGYVSDLVTGFAEGHLLCCERTKGGFWLCQNERPNSSFRFLPNFVWFATFELTRLHVHVCLWWIRLFVSSTRKLTCENDSQFQDAQTVLFKTW